MPSGRIVAAALVIVVIAGGCRSLTGRSAGRWADDHTISNEVRARLAAVRSLPFTRVKVDTFEGTVYLTGTVDSEGTKQRLEQLARGVEHVEQVVTNLTVGSSRAANAAASPALPGPARAALGPVTHPLMSILPGLARMDGDGVASPGGPYRAFDRAGTLVATVYTVSMRDLAQYGLENIVPSGAPVDHVSIYPIATDPDVPQPQYHVVLWHVSRTEAAALR